MPRSTGSYPGPLPSPFDSPRRTAVIAGGEAVRRIPESDDEPTRRASLRTAGRLASVGAVGGVAFELADALRQTLPARSPLRPILMGGAVLAGSLYYADQHLHQREAVVTRWTEEDEAPKLPAALGVGFVVTTVGRGIGQAFMTSRRASVSFFGEDPVRSMVGRALNAAGWAAGAAALYSAGVGYVATKERRGRACVRDAARPPLLIGRPQQHLAVRTAGVTGATVRHRRRHSRADRVDDGRTGRRAPDPRVRRGEQ